ncbi:MAG: gliding motility-associated C-terminal domain-containing protein, partial [Aquaticitalea sp.]
VVDLAGIYTYTVTGTPPCDDASATVTVTLNPKPDAGTNGSLDICENDTTLQDLFDILGGNPDAGGTWSPALASGTGIYNPVVDTAGPYTYTVSGISTCGDDSATVTVTIIPNPDAGTNGTLDLCENDAPQDLFNSLGGTPDVGGTWSPTLASGSGIFDPSRDSAGTYTYTVTGTTPCADVSATVSVNINPMPNVGTNGSLDICETDTTLQDLFNSLGGTPDAGGIWSPALVSGTGIFNPAVDAAGTYTYTIIGTPPCGDASATVTVAIVPIPDAGTDGTLNLCENDAPQDLFNSLGGTPDVGGSWSPALASGSGIFDPSLDTAGTYTYTVTGTQPCGDASATVTVTINPIPDAGTNGALAICLDDAPQDLFDSLEGTPDVGGTWSPSLASGTGVFDPTVDAAVIYTYTVTGIAPCGDASATVTITIKPIPNAGTDGILNLCSNNAPVNIFDSLGGSPDGGGIWSPSLASTSGIFDPAVDMSGIYTYTLSGAGYCGEDTATVTVYVTTAPNLTGLTITVDSVCLKESSEVTISGATQLTDGEYSFTYTLFGANSSQTTVVILIVNGAASFDIPAFLLTNPGSNTFTLADLTYNATSCNANVGTIPTVNFDVIQDPTPHLITNGNSFCLENTPTIADLTANLIDTNPVTWYDALENGNPYSENELLVDGTTYYASNLIEDGCNNGIRLAVTVSIQMCAELELIIPDGFSPNDDGINDQFVIKNLRELYPDFKLQIYNRYGNVLYEGDINTSDWNGKSDKGRELGNSTLPVGVYFFILELNDSTNRTIQGRVYLSR